MRRSIPISFSLGPDHGAPGQGGRSKKLSLSTTVHDGILTSDEPCKSAVPLYVHRLQARNGC